MAKQAKTINAQFDNHAKAYVKRGVMLHKTLVEALRRVQEHGDLSSFIYGANTLAKTGVARRAVLQWMQKHGRCKLVVVSAGGGVSFTMKPKAKWSDIDVDKADKLPFYADDGADGKTNEDTKSFSLIGRVKSAIKKAGEIDVDHTGYDMSKTDTGSEDLIAQLEQVLNTFDPANKSDKPLFDRTLGAVTQSMVG